MFDDVSAVDPTDMNRTEKDWDTVTDDDEVLLPDDDDGDDVRMGTSETTISALTAWMVAAVDESWVTVYETDLTNPWQNPPAVVNSSRVLFGAEKMQLLFGVAWPRYPLVEQSFATHRAVTSSAGLPLCE